MKYIPWLILVLVTTGLAGLVIDHRMKVRAELRAQAKREAAYQNNLSSYTQILKPGMTRREVEDYLRANKIEFQQMCCVDSSELSRRHSWDDLVKIGGEDPPWFCREFNVYVAFQYTARDNRNRGGGLTAWTA
jgi:hypothetical protein